MTARNGVKKPSTAEEIADLANGELDSVFQRWRLRSGCGMRRTGVESVLVTDSSTEITFERLLGVYQ
jgi:hypothetical protein